MQFNKYDKEMKAQSVRQQFDREFSRFPAKTKVSDIPGYKKAVRVNAADNEMSIPDLRWLWLFHNPLEQEPF